MTVLQDAAIKKMKHENEKLNKKLNHLGAGCSVLVCVRDPTKVEAGQGTVVQNKSSIHRSEGSPHLPT